jgi:hypothetical protein
MTREQLFQLAEFIRRESLNPSMPVEELARLVAAEAQRIAEMATNERK